MEWIETTGATIDEAKDLALDRLGVAEDELEIQVLTEPVSTMFGLKKTEARLRARVRPISPQIKSERSPQNNRDRNRKRSNQNRKNTNNKQNKDNKNKQQKSSKRNELEIVDLLNRYRKKKKLIAEFLGRGGAWLDTGSIDDFYNTSAFVSALENRQGLKIACLEEIAFNNKWISKKEIRDAINFYGNCMYSNYLKKLI